jgi:hypothetical protein
VPLAPIYPHHGSRSGSGSGIARIVVPADQRRSRSVRDIAAVAVITPKTKR